MAGPYSLGTVSCWPGHVEQMLRPHGLATTVAALPTAHRRHGLGHRQGRRPHLPRRTSLRHLRGGTPWAAVGPPHDASWRHAARGHRPRQRRAIRDRVSEPYAWTGSTSVAGRACALDPYIAQGGVPPLFPNQPKPEIQFRSDDASAIGHGRRRPQLHLGRWQARRRLCPASTRSQAVCSRAGSRI